MEKQSSLAQSLMLPNYLKALCTFLVTPLPRCIKYNINAGLSLQGPFLLLTALSGL